MLISFWSWKEVTQLDAWCPRCERRFVSSGAYTSDYLMPILSEYHVRKFPTFIESNNHTWKSEYFQIFCQNSELWNLFIIIPNLLWSLLGLGLVSDGDGYSNFGVGWGSIFILGDGTSNISWTSSCPSKEPIVLANSVPGCSRWCWHLGFLFDHILGVDLVWYRGNKCHPFDLVEECGIIPGWHTSWSTCSSQGWCSSFLL